MVSQAAGMDVNVLIRRVQRLFQLDTSVFEEIRADKAATIPAVVVAAVSMFLFGMGGWLWWVLADIPDSGDVLIKSAVIGTITGTALWVAWMAITYVTLTQLFRARVDFQELLRVMGFAAAPLAVGVLMFIPEVEFGIALTAVALFFGSTLLAVQSATDATPGRALAATGAGFLVWSVMLGLFVGEDNAYAPGIFVFDVGVEFLKTIGSFTSAF